MDDSRSLHITRRHALAVGAAAGLGVVLRPALPALGAVGAGSDRFTLGLRAGTVGRSGTAPLAAPGPFDLLGVSGDGLTHAHLEVRTRRGRGAWSAWVPLASAADHAPDGETGLALAESTDYDAAVVDAGTVTLTLNVLVRPGATLTSISVNGTAVCSGGACAGVGRAPSQSAFRGLRRARPA